MVRVKNRYISFRLLYPPNSDTSNPVPQLDILRSSPSHISPKHLINLIRSSLQENFGDYGLGLIAPALTIKYFSNKTSIGIIKCGREDLEKVCFAMLCIKKLDESGTEVIVEIKRVGGTIKKVQDYMIKKNVGLIDEIMSITG